MTPDPEPGEPDPTPGPERPYTIDISKNQNGKQPFRVDQFSAMRAAGVGTVIVKLLGANNVRYPLYTELVHQDPARAAGMTLGHYIANGPVGTPSEIAKATLATGQVRSGEILWLDVEDWPDDDVRRWVPSECEAVAVALSAAGKPLSEQGIYLNLDLANNGGYREMMERIGLRLWLAAYTDAPVVLLKGGWGRKPDLWQFTQSNIPELRGIYDANLDVNRSGAAVWLVSDLQEALNRAMPALPPLEVDNDYGRKTSARVADFQRVYGLTPDGDAGTLTLTKLLAVAG